LLAASPSRRQCGRKFEPCRVRQFGTKLGTPATTEASSTNDGNGEAQPRSDRCVRAGGRRPHRAWIEGRRSLRAPRRRDQWRPRGALRGRSAQRGLQELAGLFVGRRQMHRCHQSCPTTGLANRRILSGIAKALFARLNPPPGGRRPARHARRHQRTDRVRSPSSQSRGPRGASRPPRARRRSESFWRGRAKSENTQ
jgi:hypothetical protein